MLLSSFFIIFLLNCVPSVCLIEEEEEWSGRNRNDYYDGSLAPAPLLLSVMVGPVRPFPPPFCYAQYLYKKPRFARRGFPGEKKSGKWIFVVCLLCRIPLTFPLSFFIGPIQGNLREKGEIGIFGRKREIWFFYTRKYQSKDVRFPRKIWWTVLGGFVKN